MDGELPEGREEGEESSPCHPALGWGTTVLERAFAHACELLCCWGCPPTSLRSVVLVPSPDPQSLVQSAHLSCSPCRCSAARTQTPQLCSLSIAEAIRRVVFTAFKK